MKTLFMIVQRLPLPLLSLCLFWNCICDCFFLFYYYCWSNIILFVSLYFLEVGLGTLWTNTFLKMGVLLCCAWSSAGTLGSTNFLISYHIIWLESLAMLHSLFSAIYTYIYIYIKTKLVHLNRVHSIRFFRGFFDQIIQVRFYDELVRSLMFEPQSTYIMMQCW